MVKKSRGPKHKTRQKLTKRAREKGKITITRQIQKFNIGDKVIVKIEPSIHKGMPYPRFYGKQGYVVGRRGKAYFIAIKDQKKPKKLLCMAVHLKRAD